MFDRTDLRLFEGRARVVYLDRQPTASALMPALKAVRPTVMLIVPLIIEKIYRHQVQAKFNSNAFWRTLVGIGFMRRYLHRIAGKKLMKVFGGRLRFLGIGGAKLDTQAEQFMLEAKIPYAIGYGLTETAPLLAGAAPAGAARFDGPAAPACSCGWKTSIPIRSRARSWRSRRASCWATTRIPRRRPKSSHPTAGSAPATWAGSRPTVGFTSRGGSKT